MATQRYATRWSYFLIALAWAGTARTDAHGQAARPAQSLQARFAKTEHKIPMRDGVQLFTIVYAPRDTSQKYPMLMNRTPYSIGPYGVDNLRSGVGPQLLANEGYIFVHQDVRGCYMSEGTFVNMTPHLDKKASQEQIDESSDTHDTIDWLLKNIPNHNGRVGMYGISYPGFYSAAGMIDHHPALKAVSPQAPIADWFFDDFHHHGAFFLPHAFSFFSGFGQPRPTPTPNRRGRRIDYGTRDGYEFYLKMGSLKHADERYFKGNIAFWNEMAAHPNYDEFWKSRNLLPHLKNVAPAVMTVGGWFDAEDLYGACKIYRAVEELNPGIFNIFVMGPWAHGGWAGGNGENLGNVHFGSNTSVFYRENIELPFFNHFLKDKGNMDLPEAYVFETGANRWRTFDTWPPKNVENKTLYFRKDQRLAFKKSATEGTAHDEYQSDPNHPVPYTEAVAIGMTREYMTDDQRFAARRPDVVFYQTDVLSEDITLVGPLQADLWVSTSGTDSDWVVKLIDVFPEDTPNASDTPPGKPLAGYQMMVRSESMRGRFRNGYAKPEPFLSNQPTHVKLELQDVLHTFKKGHRIMVQVQSTWFPLIDRNPQKYVDNIFQADDKDFIKARQRLYRSKQYASALKVTVLPAEEKK
jgi:putative CocE/NonD family hydrolase